MIMSDFNAEATSARGIQLSQTITSMCGRVFRSLQATRFGRSSETELDYFMGNSYLLSQIVTDDAAAKCSTIPFSHTAIGSDHDCLLLELALKDPAQSGQRRRRRRYRQYKCRRQSVRRAALHASVPVSALAFVELNTQQQWESLKQLSDEFSFSAPSLKYKDPPGVKQLCQQRRLATDLQERARLTRLVIATRHEALLRWLQDLHDRSSRGDAGAIRYLRQRGVVHGADTEGFVAKCGWVQASIATVKQHYSELFGKQPSQEEQGDLKQALDRLSEKGSKRPPVPFDFAEVGKAMARLKSGKFTAITGISNEFLLAVWELDAGQQMIVSHLNNLLGCESLPADLFHAYVCLLPKQHQILECKDLRPINLLESIHKIFAWLLVTRLQQHWPRPGLQLGGVLGSQVVDALMCAHNRVLKESRGHKYGIWISCDVEAAFDSISQASVAAFVQEHSPDELSTEARRLLQLLIGPDLKFPATDMRSSTGWFAFSPTVQLCLRPYNV